MYKHIPGTKDILPDETSLWQSIEETSRNIFSLYNYSEIRTPALEDVSLFNRSLGESTEIVQKQMFLTKSGEDVYCLRPEATASIVRSYIENSLDKTVGFSKLYYIGPMFRHERPQKGRLRQFHHIGCEAIGSFEAELDAEVISLADYLLKGFLIQGYKIKLNSLGCLKDKARLTELLRDRLKGELGALCQDCQVRYNGNVLRILDCKNETCKNVVEKIDLKDSYLCPECKAHFLKVREGLDSLGIGFEYTPHLVRGLDYYTGTVFEISHPELGSQDALGAGGRYNNLVKELGGPDMGAIGFAFGIERLLLVTKLQGQKVTSKKLSYLISLGEEAKKQGIKLLESLREKGIACDTDYEGRSLKAAMRRANDLGANKVLILGENELKNGVITVKDMVSGEQKEVALESLAKDLKC
ncbi:MAG: histidine--tRNA ligase [Candidatus Omnitrophica bacterium]|nr:histidine--tRNA ligase [Candidatus Omnitrophota bacterium]MBU1870464.1 histidine--tRNA ligase [Candidatus Omnitrophota bacterium]